MLANQQALSNSYRYGRPTIGVLAGWQFSRTTTPLSYLNPIFHGNYLAAHDLGCNVLLSCGMGLWLNQRSVLHPAWPLIARDSDFVPIGPWNTDGLIVVNPLHSQERSHYIQNLIAKGHPVIFIASGEKGPAILADNRSGILQAMEHLVEHGHQRIAFIAGTPKDIEGDTGERLQAYHDAVAAHGLAADSRLVIWGHHAYDNGYAAMGELLTSETPFTAVLASNDESALGAMKALQEAGRQIPEDVAIIGFDNRAESAVQTPPLSSVSVPLLRMGYHAVESLYRYLNGDTEVIESTQLATRLLKRKSCGCRQQHLNRSEPQTELRSQLPSIKTNLLAQRREQSTLFQLNSEPGLAKRMAEPIQAEAQALPAKRIESLCQTLIEAFHTSVVERTPQAFQAALEESLQQVTALREDAHVWQTAITVLAKSVIPSAQRERAPAAPNLAQELVDQARITISAKVQRQHHQHMVDQRWTLNRLGTLTAQLLTALDESQVYQILAQQLPEMDIDTMFVGRFKAEENDPVAITRLRLITSEEKQLLQFPSREFPPPELVPKEQPFSLALFPLTDAQGQLGFVAFDTEQLDLYGLITQQLATALNSVKLYHEAVEGRQLAEEANELKSRFLSTVSHELRTPLNLIVGLSGMLVQKNEEREVPLPEEYYRDVTQIHTNAQLLGGLIGDVLDLASSDAGKLTLANEFVDLSDTLNLVVETGRQLAQQKGLKWQAELPEVGPYVWGDRMRLRQVALNMIKNAVKFTDQGQVQLKIETENDTVTVSVCDTGLGIPPEEQKSVFNEFERSARSKSQGYSGLGLGLAICKRLIDLHEGTMGVESSGVEGAGSTFYFTLPTVHPKKVQRESEKMTLTEESVLVLTSHTESEQQLKKHLRERGLDVQMLFMEETPDWLSQILISPPGVIVVDVSSTPHHGWSVLKAIKGHPHTRHLPVLFYSLSKVGDSVLEFDYLTKPIEMTNLTQALDQQWLPPELKQEHKTILVVEDDINTLDMQARIVKSHSASHRILKARNGLEALEIVQQEPVDLVLLDLIMPGLDGFGLLEIMRSENSTRDIPVIVLTGQVLTEKDMERLNRGVTAVLSKGVFNRDETLKHVEEALEHNRALSGEAQRLVRQAMAYIHEHYAESISRYDLAQHVALSEDYLTDCFRKELGVTPITYINRYRIHQAQILLTESYKNITEIALDVGFSDSSYFSRVFRREVGMSPTDYRQR